jgi:sugar O-acyltransferase (sialic acid O-acetyltransferase NeuD family)
MQDIVIVGARGLGRDLVGYIESGGNCRIVCLLDELPDRTVLGHPVIHPSEYDGSCRDALLAVGYPQDKKAILDRYAPLRLRWLTYIDPRAYVSPHARIAEGSLVAPFAHVGSEAVVGRFVLVSRYASLGHGATIGDFSSLMPKACLCGGAQVGSRTLIAVGADVLPDIRVGDDCRISAGTAVSRPVAAGTLVAGGASVATRERR